MDAITILNETDTNAVRSSGPGGQHANKVSTKIQLYFNIWASDGLSDDEKVLLRHNLQSRITKTGILIVSCDRTRSQSKNKDLAQARLLDILASNCIPNKVRKKSRIPRSVKKKRLDTKKKNSEKKLNRRKPDY